MRGEACPEWYEGSTSTATVHYEGQAPLMDHPGPQSVSVHYYLLCAGQGGRQLATIHPRPDRLLLRGLDPARVLAGVPPAEDRARCDDGVGDVVLQSDQSRWPPWSLDCHCQY